MCLEIMAQFSGRGQHNIEKFVRLKIPGFRLMKDLIDVVDRPLDSRLEGGVNRAKLKFTNINTTTSRVSVRNIKEFTREGPKQIASE
jgi:hypothetical protein